MEWKKLVILAWDGGLKAVLHEIAQRSTNKWDDKAINLVDEVIKQVLS
jgi:hypothetical protein